MSIHYFGIRHHGPGCAKALEQSLLALQPDCVLIEGPPEGDALLSLAADPTLVPPVALLIYPPQAPRLGVFYPFASFSPEWRAIRYALEHAVPVHFIDLPPTHRFAEQLSPPEETEEPFNPQNPLATLSHSAGFEHEEEWWEQHIEQRRDYTDVFEAIAQAMSALRENHPTPLHEQQREAHMRQAIRKAEQQGFNRIAVVCGAWHVPALMQKVSSKHDQTLLKGLPKIKTEAAWIPWSNDRLSRHSGYGAGIESPGWYLHIWQNHEAPIERWISLAAQHMRQEGLDASSANIIEATRLAKALAALRNQAHPGLNEINEALLSVLCQGNPITLHHIRHAIEIGDLIGKIPVDSKHIPLQQDLEQEQKRLRLKPSTEIKQLDIDLREDNGRARSHLLHRLNILEVRWGEQKHAQGKSGTFHEYWQIQWQPELQLNLIDAGRYGHTLQAAASAKLEEIAQHNTELPTLTTQLDWALLADLPTAVDALLNAVRNGAALSSDIQHIMQALPPLTRIARYGDVRGTTISAVKPIIHGLIERITIGLPLAACGIDEEAANALVLSITEVQTCINTLNQAEWSTDWLDCLAQLIPNDQVAPTVRGYAVRVLFDNNTLSEEELNKATRQMLGPANPPATTAAWLGGMLRGSALLLLNKDTLWHMLDTWMAQLEHDTFQTLLPPLRRAFSNFTVPERRRMHDKVKNLGNPSSQRKINHDLDLDIARAQRVLPTLKHLLGITP